MTRLEDALLVQRGHLYGWVPVCLAIGIGIYFSLRVEPGVWVFILMGGLALGCAVLALWAGAGLSPVPVAVMLILVGFVLAGARAHHVAGPVLSWRYYGPVEGRVIAIDRSSSDAMRVTLDRVILSKVSPGRTPHRVRISLHDKSGLSVALQPGMRVMTTAHLSGPNGPAEPYGFDFQRQAWFLRLGAVGYNRVPLLAIEAPPKDSWDLLVFRVRMAASARIQMALPGDTGGFGAAVTTGDRSAISQEALAALRASNTAHLLAISGLHMGLLCGFVFSVVRLALALVLAVALRVDTRRIAAGFALLAGAVYLSLSGGNVATQRAFIMVAAALLAVFLGRRAISLRTVALAAVAVLVLRPESLMGPGFQMSFAATTALVAVYGALRGRQIRLPKWAAPVAAVLSSSAIAGLATAPVGAAHFNTMSSYGLIANFASVPLMGSVVIPSAVLALLLAPFGLDWIALKVMGLGLRWILEVAQFVSSLEGARRFVMTPPNGALALLALGALVLVLWQGRGRWAGPVMMMAALAAWGMAQRPLALIAQDGVVVGVMTEAGRAISRKRGGGFTVRNWLENDGDPADQTAAAGRWQGAIMPLGSSGRGIEHLAGKRAQQKFETCVPGQILVLSVAPQRRFDGCDVYDPKRLRSTGALMIYLQNDKLVVRSTRDVLGQRLWSNWPKPRQ